MEYKDYYKVMGLERSASAEEIKHSYRKLARKYHPDVSKEANAEARFKELGEAYAVLSDAEKRKQYDQLGSQWQSGQQFNTPPDWQTYANNGGTDFNAAGSDYSDFFESLFGRAEFRQQHHGHREYNQRGKDLRSKILISLEDAYQGATRAIQIDNRTLNIKIPAGVTQGQHIRLAGQGGAGIGKGTNGDLYLEIDLQPHALYKLDDNDIYLTLPITPWEAALGATIAVPTLGGKVELKIPANSQSGQKLRLRGRGMPGKTPGNQYVVLEIQTPKADTETARELYQQMEKAMPFNPRQNMGG